MGSAKSSTEGQKNRPGGRSGLGQVMGDLEAEVMECVWELGSASVRDVHRCLLESRDIAYTTVMTVMSRLATKGLLVSHPEGRAYIYRPSADRETFCAGVVKDFMSGMLADADRGVLAHFVDSVTEGDRSQLELLAEIIEERRREEGTSRS